MAATERAPLPNSLPRPPGELEQLEQVWAQPRGWRLPSAVNNTWVAGSSGMRLTSIGVALFSRGPVHGRRRTLQGEDSFEG